MNRDKGPYDSILLKRKAITEQYTYTPYNLPKAPSPPAISPRRKKQLIPVTRKFQDVGNIVDQIEGTTILTYPHDAIADMRQEVRDSEKRLKLIKNGYSIQKAVLDNYKKCEFQQTKTLHLKDRIISDNAGVARRSVRNTSNVYVYHEQNSISASEIQNEFNILRHNINEMKRKQYNEVAKEINLRNRRRPYALRQMYHDMEKYGLEESVIRARNSRRYSSLKNKRDDIWWDSFIDSIPNELRNENTMKIISDFSAIHNYHLKIIKQFVIEHSKTLELLQLCEEIIKAANKQGNFIESWRLDLLFESIKEKRIQS